MNLDMAHEHNALGANWAASGSDMIVSDYGNTEAAVRAAHETVALIDRSHWGRLEIRGKDRLRLLHNQTTADLNRAEPGQIVDAVVVTSIARTVDYVTTLVTDETVVLIASPERLDQLLNWFPRFIFFNDDVTVENITEKTAMFSLIGPRSAELLGEVVDDGLPAAGTHAVVTLAGAEVRVAYGSGLSLDGFTLLTPADTAAVVFQALIQEGSEFGLEAMGQEAWEQLRVRQGRPAADHEITEDHNPLEAGLWHAISFNKGCYIGQEIIARLDTYDKIKQHLMNVKLSAVAEVGAELYDEDDTVIGTLTSVTETGDGPVGIAYVHRSAAEIGRHLTIRTDGGEIDAELIAPQYVRLGRPDDLPERV